MRVSLQAAAAADVVAARRRHGGYPWRWCIVSDPVRRLVCDELNTVSAFKVFHRLPDYLTWTEFRALPRKVLAEDLGISGVSVSTALRQLHQLGVIDRQGKGPVTQWRLSLETGWRGNVASYRAAVAKQADAVRKQAGKPVLRLVPGTIEADEARAALAMVRAQRQPVVTKKARASSGKSTGPGKR